MIEEEGVGSLQIGDVVTFAGVRPNWRRRLWLRMTLRPVPALQPFVITAVATSDAEGYLSVHPNTTNDPRAMRWPTWRHKIGGPHFIRWPCNAGFFVDFRNWYYGNYLMVSFGRFAFKMGCGTYD